MRRLLIGCAFGVVVCLGGVAGPLISAAMAQAQPDEQRLSHLAARARGASDADALAAANEAEALVNKEPWTYRRPAKPVVEALIATRRYEAAEKLARAVMLGAPTDWWLVNYMQMQRIECYLQQGKWDEAIGAAKGLYNFCDFRQLKPAIEEVARVLIAIDPQGGPARAKRFKDQQQAWATKAPAEGDPLGQPVLAGVTVDGSGFEEYLKRPSHSNIYTAAINRGLVLLLVDKPEEAMQAFREAGGLAAAEPRRSEVALCMARAMRARDQHMAGATEYLKSVGVAIPK